MIGQTADTPPSPGWGPSGGPGDRLERQLAKVVGLTQFGVNHLTLQPGAQSSRRHWHEEEDEFVLVLSGRVTVRNDDGETEIGPGGYAGFPAGVSNAHHLVNRSAEAAEFLVVGARKVGVERIHYPDEPDPGPFLVVRNDRGVRIGP